MKNLNLENLKQFKNFNKIEEAINFGENVVVVSKWAFTNTKAAQLASTFDIYFYENETEKAILFASENGNKVWLPKSQVYFYNKDKGMQITKAFVGLK